MVFALMVAPSVLAQRDRILVVTATAGFRHDSIPAAEAVITGIGEQTGWFVATFVREESEMPTALSAASLADVKAVLFVNTTGELAPESRGPLLDWIRNGGTFLGVHSASDTWHSSSEYVDMLGGEFDSHPDQSLVEIVVETRTNAATLSNRRSRSSRRSTG